MRLINRLIPFLIAGILLAAIAFGLVLLAYLFLIGTVAGMILYAVAWVRERFFTPKKPARPPKTSGRVIDSDEWRKL